MNGFRKIACTVLVGGLLGMIGQSAEAIGFVKSVTDVKVWLKEHPGVDPNNVKNPDGSTSRVVQVSSVKEWLKAHPEVDPNNRKPADIKVAPPRPQPLSPMLVWGAPPRTHYAHVVVYSPTENMATIYENDHVKGGFLILPIKLKPGTEYIWQIVHVKSSTEVVDGGTYKFVTAKDAK